MTEIINVTPDTTTEPDQAHIDAMVAKAESGITSPAPPEKSLLAGKYKNEDELGKGILELIKKQKGGNLEDFYKELESGLGKDKGDSSVSEDVGGDKDGTTDESIKNSTDATDEVKDKAEDKGFSLNKFSQEYADTGKLSDDSYAELEKAGITRQVVDTYIKGQQAIVDSIATKIFDSVGGEETYAAMMQWASSNLTEGEKKMYNEAVGSMDADKYGLAVKGLMSRYTAAVGKEPQLLKGATTTPTAGFESWEQVKAAMKDPRYTKDVAFRKSVEVKLSHSNL